jgi:GDP-mannose 6-dehydrogenase
MRVSVFGLGYVGTVCAGCLANRGHDVIGIETSETKIDLLLRGQSPVVEANLDDLIRGAVNSGHLTATSDPIAAVSASDISLICVGTPSKPSGGVDIGAISHVAMAIGEAIRLKDERHTIVVRSTVVPGTTREIIMPQVQRAAGNAAFRIAFNPEFMREGSGVVDFNMPSKTIVGTLENETEEVGAAVLELYQDLPGPKIVTNLESAELMKYVDNSWHAVKVAFANEIGVIAKTLGINSRDIMDVFIQDRRLNISQAYLRPGFAFGGSCLPKDLRALTYLAQTLGLSLPLLGHVLDSNRVLTERGIAWILNRSKKRIVFLGISFKSGTDDLRESPFIELVERLSGKGREIRIYDPNVQLARLVGANREYLNRVLPHVQELLIPDMLDALTWADTIVMTAADLRYIEGLANTRPDQIVLDFSGADLSNIPAKSEGFLW